MPRTFYVYILANRSRTLYVGVTNDLARRMAEHRSGKVPGFARRYMVRQLVYVESTTSARDAIAREKQIKGWARAKKIALIDSQNPKWLDLATSWFGDGPLPGG